MKNWMILAALCCSACSAGFAMRNAESYEQDTREVLTTRDTQVQSCYNDALKQDPTLSGNVVVKFDVTEETGKIDNASIVEEDTSAPVALQQCVLDALQGLELTPPDEQKGVATYTWSFSPSSHN